MTPTCRCGSPMELRRKTGMSAATPVHFCSSCSRIESIPARELRQIPASQILSLKPCTKKRKPQPTARKRVYQQALKSEHWKKLRERVRARCEGRCEVPGCEGDFEELAHLIYERLGAERDEDVQAQCKAHNQGEREQRITRHVLGGQP